MIDVIPALVNALRERGVCQAKGKKGETTPWSRRNEGEEEAVA